MIPITHPTDLPTITLCRYHTVLPDHIITSCLLPFTRSYSSISRRLARNHRVIFDSVQRRPSPPYTMAPKKSTKAKGKAPTSTASMVDPLFPSRPRSFNVDGAIRPAGCDLSRVVRLPKYVRIQRQRVVLYQSRRCSNC